MAGRAVENGHTEDTGASTVVQVAVGEAHTLALTANGNVYTWGRGQFGRMGMGVFQDELVPTHVEILPTGVEPDELGPDNNSTPAWDPAERSRITQLAAGAYHSLALSGDGTVWSWGFNACQLGREGAASYPAPISFLRPSSFSFDDGRDESQNTDGTTKVLVVEAGGMMSSAIDKDGGLWLWGAVPEPSAGVQITDSDSYHKSDEFELANIDKPGHVLALRHQRVRRVACGNEHILALVEDGSGSVECYAWGSNSYGQLGLGDFEARDMPTLVTAVAAAPRMGITIVDFACGAFHSVVVTTTLGRDDDDGGETEKERRTRDDARAAAQLMDHVMTSPKLRGRVMPPEQYMKSPRARARQPGGNYQSGYGSDGSTARAYAQISSMTSWVENGGRARENGEFFRAGDHGRVSTCWTFGQGDNGQLGHGARANSHTPAAVEALPTRERIQVAVCGLFHTAVVTESGDVWVWGMEGGLGQCPGIGPPGSKTGDALTPVRVFGESSAKCHPISGAKGIACGAAHTVTVSNGGTDLWAWGRGKNGVLGLGHHSDSWFPSPVVWPPGSQQFTLDVDADVYPDLRKLSSRASSRGGGSRGRGDDIRPYVVEDAKPPRSSSYGRLPEQYVADDRPPRSAGYSSLRKGLESPGRPSSRRGSEQSAVPQSPSRRDHHTLGSAGMQSTSPSRLSRRGDHFWPPVTTPEPGNSFRRDPEDVTSLTAELTECRRYAESLHAAVYGGVESFALELPRMNAYNNGRKPTHGYVSNAAAALQNWQQHVEDASLEELSKLEIFYKGMRNRLKDVLFQRRMEDWCRRTMSGILPAAAPPVVRGDAYSVQTAPYFDGPGELTLRMAGIMSDHRGEMLSPDALAASLAELRMHFQRRR